VIFWHCIQEICALLYLPGGGVDTPQFCSSDMSPQSLSPSQIHRAGIQRPVLAHWNEFGGHVRAAFHEHNHIMYVITPRQTLSSVYTLSVHCISSN